MGQQPRVSIRSDCAKFLVILHDVCVFNAKMQNFTNSYILFGIFKAFLVLYAILCAQNLTTAILAAQNNTLLESLQ